MLNRKVIGIDRKIDREWLDAVLDRFATGSDLAATRAFLHDLLQPQHPAQAARQKTVGILLRIWPLASKQHQGVRSQALTLLPAVPSRDRVWLHWGMAVLTYPLFRDTAAAVGRLLKLQGDFTLAQLERRLVEDWGDRSTLRRAAQRIVRSMVQWGVLAEVGRGKFGPAPKRMSGSSELQLWMMEALHLADGSRELESHQLLTLPTAFPFQINVGLGDLRRSDRFAVHRQGLDMDMVAVNPRPQKAGRGDGEAPPLVAATAAGPGIPAGGSLFGVGPDSPDTITSVAASPSLRLDHKRANVRASEAPIPASLARFAAEMGLAHTLVLNLLDMQRQVVAHRSGKKKDDLESVDWRSLYLAMKESMA